ncbi:metallophosphoesterase family protein [Methanocaldococcus fervens]|uniref:Metallophosphoesterase n=1 Tax=Methanocaldococcus fervens (strain DSM 4213 / JCM 15782 / AG86) TaxID=573064 RepID=C7P5R9_METFA|nr:metallophosphoesterase family protein [Methanocaldococcus fervens]ACV23901.1 metallophosphoesterase [Methanocaldococcus fervens AG86]
MMAIISDIHSNLEALEAVLNDIKNRGIKNIVCLGDIVGYGANPNECVELIKGAKCKCVAGNHDYGVLGKESLDFFNKYGAIAILWTKKFIKPENLKFLDSLPLVIEEKIKNKKIIFSHANPKYPELWEYLYPDYVDEVFDCGDLIFVGHSHIPFVNSEEGNLLIHKGSVYLEEDKKYLINPGSIGQPRDGINKASYCIFDEKNFKIEIVRVEYNIKGAYEKIVKSGLPEWLGERLFLGR